MKRINWSHSAAADLRDIERYLAGYHPSIARETVERVVTAARFLVVHRSIGTPVSARWRKWRVPGTQYLLVYRPMRDGIEVGRVRHDRSNWTEVPS